MIPASSASNVTVNERQQAYREGGIWTFESDRTSCLIPQKPKSIFSPQEEQLEIMAAGIWEALNVVTDVTSFSNELPWKSFSDSARAFPEGITLPPLVRVDVVESFDGDMKVVEIDPVTAISLGETAFLTDVWSTWPEDSSEVYAIIPSPVDTIVRYAEDLGVNELVIDVPNEKRQYFSELGYLAQKLNEAGLETRIGIDLPKTGIVQLSAFAEVPRVRKKINKSTNNWTKNPLWGSMLGLIDKSSLELLGRCSERLRAFLPAEYSQEALANLDPETQVVMKPKKGTGSAGVQVIRACEAFKESGCVFQEMVLPRKVYFGEVITPDGTVLNEEEPWIARLSVYVGKYGLAGAQVTARRSEGVFTNVHGQSDAVQSPLTVWGN